MCRRWFETWVCPICLRAGITRFFKRTCWHDDDAPRPTGWVCREAPVHTTQDGQTNRHSHRGIKEKFHWMKWDSCSYCWPAYVMWLASPAGTVGMGSAGGEMMLDVTRQAIADVRDRYRNMPQREFQPQRQAQGGGREGEFGGLRLPDWERERERERHRDWERENQREVQRTFLDDLYWDAVFRGVLSNRSGGPRSGAPQQVVGGPRI